MEHQHYFHLAFDTHLKTIQKISKELVKSHSTVIKKSFNRH